MTDTPDLPPPSGPEKRRLAAIVFTDVVSYSARMQRDEAGTIELVAADFATMRKHCEAQHGEVLNSMGDGLLLCFDSAVQAVACALKIQTEFQARGKQVESEQNLEHRMGIHIGDVFRQETGGVTGDGVNIAARLEGKAPIGGVCISQMVYDTVKGKVPMQALFIGPQEFKNITEPIQIWHISPEHGATLTRPAFPVAAKQNSASRTPLFVGLGIAAAMVVALLLWRPWTKPNPETNPAAVPTPVVVIDEKSIAVLPFENRSANAENAFFADGIHENILTNLTVIKDLHVVSRTSVMQYRSTTKPIPQIGAELSVAYVLEGSVQRAGEQVRVSGQLINTGTDQSVWSQTYDRNLTDIFAIQAELSEAIADALSAVLSPQEKSQLGNRPTSNSLAYDLYLSARSDLNGYTADLTTDQIEEMLNTAVSLDPKFAEAWAYRSLNHSLAYFSDLDRAPERLAKAKKSIETAAALSPDNPVVIEMQGNYHYYGYRDYFRAAGFYQRLLGLRPNSAEALAQMGLLYRRQGQWADALAYLRKAIKLDPPNPMLAYSLAETLLKLRHYDEAEAEYRRALTLTPDDLYLATEIPLLAFTARGSTQEMEAWLARQNPTEDDEITLLEIRLDWANLTGDWDAAIRLSSELDAAMGEEEEFNWMADFGRLVDRIEAEELPAARELGERMAPQLDALLIEQERNSLLRYIRALVYVLAEDRDAALACADRLQELIPESVDALDGVVNSEMAAQIRAWVGDKETALAELERLLNTPWGSNVHIARFDIGWRPLRRDPRFEALLSDPKNNAPLY